MNNMYQKTTGIFTAIILSLSFLWSLLFPFPVYAEKNATCKSGDVQITLSEDGSAQITETWVCYFGGGDFSRYGRTYYRSEDYRLENFSATLDGQPLKLLSHSDDNRPEGYFAVTDSAQQTVVDFYHRSSDVNRTFTLNYRVSCAVLLKDGAAKLQWNLSGADEISEIGTLTATVILPRAIDPKDYQIQVNGPSDSTFLKSGDGKVQILATEVPRGTPVDISLTMPEELFPEATSHGTDMGMILLLCIPFLSVLILLLFTGWRRKRINKNNTNNGVYTPMSVPQYYHTLPSELAPALVNKLFYFYREPKVPSGVIDGNNLSSLRFVTTLMDLSERGYLSLQPLGNDTEITVSPADTLPPLLPCEQVLMDILADIAKVEIPFTMNGLTAYITTHPQEMNIKMEYFQSAVTDELDRLGLVDSNSRAVHKNRKTLGITVGAVVGLLLLGTSGAFFIMTKEWIGFTIMLPLILGAVGFCLPYGILTAPKPHLTQEGENELALWEAFSRYLSDITNVEHIDLLEFALWRRYSIYALALGNNRKIFEFLNIQYPQMHPSNEQECFERLLHEQWLSVPLESIQVDESEHGTGGSSAD